VSIDHGEEHGWHWLQARAKTSAPDESKEPPWT
jgi:hypothetical protein